MTVLEPMDTVPVVLPSPSTKGHGPCEVFRSCTIVAVVTPDDDDAAAAAAAGGG